MKYPIIIAIVFTAVLLANNQIDSYCTYSYYRDITDFSVPIKKELENNEFLKDEAIAETYVLNIWATWCGPCQKEVPELNNVLEKHENDKTLFLSITNENEKKVLDWMNLQKNESEYYQVYQGQKLMNYLFSLNPDPTIKKGSYPELLPTNIIIHKGKVVYFEQGYSEDNISKMDSTLSSFN